MNLSRSQRSFMAQFRSGVLPLRIETGRFRGEPISERVCTLCHDDVVENEVHFLLHCSFYNDLRVSFFDFGDEYTDLPENEKLRYLVARKVRKMTRFIEKAFLRRRDNLYINS